MKNIIRKIRFILIGTIFFLSHANASHIVKNYNDTILIASKESKVIKYNLLTDVLICYDNQSKKANGKLIAVSKERILIMTNDKRTSTVSVPINKIDSIIKLHKSGRRGWIPMLFTLFLLTIFGLFLLSKNNFLTIFALGIPVVSLFTYLPFLTINFLSDLFSKKSTKKGWIFSFKK